MKSMCRATNEAARMNGSPVTMATIIRWMAAAGGVMLPGAVLATGLHQTTLEYVPEMILAFGVLRRHNHGCGTYGFVVAIFQCDL